MALIPGGDYRLGSDSAERELGYELSPPAVRGYGWYDNWEAAPHRVTLEPFLIDRAPVTQREYAEFVAATGHRVPHIDEAAYTVQGFIVHPYEEVQPFNWRGGAPDSALLDHPVVLVDLEDARAYCAWRSSVDGLALRLPSEGEWEATCRGKEARTFPWGFDWRGGAAQLRLGTDWSSGGRLHTPSLEELLRAFP
jgi:formylglycine-generating enzyme required for sulfatase activity